MVVHVLPLDMARGAQVFARGLCDELGPEHRVLTLFAGEPAVLRPDVKLGVPPGRLRKADPRALLRLRRALRRLRPSAVVAHGGEALRYAALARPRGTPLVYLKIGLTKGLLRGRARLALLRAVARRADAVVGVSDEMVEEARELLGVPALLIPNGRDHESYIPGPGSDPPRAAFVGELNAAKRPDLFCDVIREVRGRGTSLDAVVVGDGPLRPRLEGVEVLGRRDDVPALLAGSDLLVFTGSGVEGMPGVLIEAGLCGLPAVTTDVPGARSVMADGVTGFVAADRPGLVEHVDRLARDADLRRRMGAAARERCLERFTMEASARQWQALLEALPRGASPERAVREALGVQ
jgi:glycosyltransferase involved in cell wall biosynthesis